MTLRQLKEALDELPAESLDMEALVFERGRNLVHPVAETLLAGELGRVDVMDAIFQLAEEQPLLVVS